MKIIMNELAHAENIINNKMIDNENFYIDLYILTKYLKTKEYTFKNTVKFIDKLMKEIIIGFNIEKYTEYIEKKYKQKNTLYAIDHVPVTKTEMDKIKDIKSLPEERVMFTLLVLAKFNNLKHDKNNSWVNYDERTIFELANSNKITSNNRDKMYYDLKELGYIKNSKKLTSLNSQVLIVDTREEVLKVTELENLGYQYERTLLRNNIRVCTSCGKLYRLKGKNERASLCPKCMPKKQVYMIKRCEVCGEEFICSTLSSKTRLCPEHQRQRDNEKAKIRMKNMRNKQMLR